MEHFFFYATILIALLRDSNTTNDLRMEFLKIILEHWDIPVTLMIGVVFGLLLLTFFPALDTSLSRLFAALGWLGKWFRRKSLETEIRGAVNGFARDLNSTSGLTILPECSIEWVTDKNQGAILQPNKAIVRVSFSSRDHALNYYNAAQTYVAESLLAKTKPFLESHTSRSIDLIMIRKLLLMARRESLRIFNRQFNKEQDDVKTQYHEFEETEVEGHFSRILLPELDFFGHVVGDSAPNEELVMEAEDFVRWFCNLATRDPGEDTVLSFERTHIKVGVILVASQATYETHGVDPYIRRAYQYAGRNCGGIYILSRGRRRSDLALEISRLLCKTEGFTRVTQRAVQRVFLGGDDCFVTCVLLRPDISVIAFNAWQALADAHSDGENVQGTVDYVSNRDVQVWVMGQFFTLPLNQLSRRTLASPFDWFRQNQELSLRVLSVDPDRQEATLSNVGTATDPDRLITMVDNVGSDVVNGCVDRIAVNRDKFEVGLRVTLKLPADEDVKAFVPRRYAVRSRYVSLRDKYQAGAPVRLAGLEFEPDRGQICCRIADLADPWESISKYQVGQQVTTVIREITENHAICELEEGIDGYLHFRELAWGDDEACLKGMQKLEVGSDLDVLITTIDVDRRQLRVSVKQLTKSPSFKWCKEHREHVVKGVVTQVDSKWAELSIAGLENPALLEIREVSWWYTATGSNLNELWGS